MIVDENIGFPNGEGRPLYAPHNYDFKFDGPMTIRHALATSKNVPAVKTLMHVGVQDFLTMAGSLGIKFHPDVQPGLSLGLGGGETTLLNMVGAYAALDNNGVFMPPVAILKIEDSQGNVVDEYIPPEGRQIASPIHAYMITSIISDNVAREPLQGLNSPLRLTRPAAAKTGSTDEYRDSWLIGYTPTLATGVWVGNTDLSPMKEVPGSLGAGRIWNQFMEEVHAGQPPTDFAPPPGIREYRICKETGGPPTPDCERVLMEVYPELYQPAQQAVIEGLPQQSQYFGNPLGRTFSPEGTPLVPIGTSRAPGR